MLVLNHLQAIIRVNNKRALFEVRYSIKIPRTPRSGIGKSLTLTVYRNGLT